jgi:nucleotide-binding universal stress UspA family protein
MSARRTAVVGVDGSDRSRSALELALKDAARRGAAVRVVRALPDTTAGRPSTACRRRCSRT